MVSIKMCLTSYGVKHHIDTEILNFPYENSKKKEAFLAPLCSNVVLENMNHYN